MEIRIEIRAEGKEVLVFIDDELQGFATRLRDGAYWVSCLWDDGRDTATTAQHVASVVARAWRRRS